MPEVAKRKKESQGGIGIGASSSTIECLFLDFSDREFRKGLQKRKKKKNFLRNLVRGGSQRRGEFKNSWTLCRLSRLEILKN